MLVALKPESHTLMVVFQPKGKKDEVIEKDDEVPQFIEKKIKSA